MKSKQIQKSYEDAEIEVTEIVESPRLKIREEKINFKNGQQKLYHIVSHPGASAILPIMDNGDLLFVVQYRHAVKEILLEIPAGVIEHHEDPSICALRELREETGMNAHHIERFLDIYTTPGFTDEKLYLFTAQNLYPDPLTGEDSHEIDLFSCSINEALQMIAEGRIVDAKTIIAILSYDRALKKKDTTSHVHH
ncbi:MAG: NUDIX hydrolase [Simkaniaceae bacterium]|nr:NUDIX hydrolase [Simkaniaceae bacterium]